MQWIYRPFLHMAHFPSIFEWIHLFQWTNDFHYKNSNQFTFIPYISILLCAIIHIGILFMLWICGRLIQFDFISVEAGRNSIGRDLTIQVETV